jgi:hypothetical protein
MARREKDGTGDESFLALLKQIPRPAELFGKSSSSVIAAVACSAFFVVNGGRDPRYCFGFALVVILIYAIWTIVLLILTRRGSLD